MMMMDDDNDDADRRESQRPVSLMMDMPDRLTMSESSMPVSMPALDMDGVRSRRSAAQTSRTRQQQQQQQQQLQWPTPQQQYAQMPLPPAPVQNPSDPAPSQLPSKSTLSIKRVLLILFLGICLGALLWYGGTVLPRTLMHSAPVPSSPILDGQFRAIDPASETELRQITKYGKVMCTALIGKDEKDKRSLIAPMYEVPWRIVAFLSDRGLCHMLGMAWFYFLP